MTGAAFPLGDKVVFRPSLLAKFVQNAPPQVDLNASFLFVNTLWLGVSYRTEKAISFITAMTRAFQWASKVLQTSGITPLRTQPLGLR